MYRNIFYSFACLAFTIMIGGAVYEHLAIVPRWAAGPPASLAMFQGEYGLNPGIFWMIMHPLIFALFTITLILHWKTDRRKNILVTFISYAVIIAITTVYFVPELMAITNTPFSETTDSTLTERAKRWEMLSICRLVILLVLAIILFLGLAKPPHIKTASSS